MEKNVLKTGSGDIAYWVSDEIRADRKSIFFLHGMTADHRLFEKQFTAFEDRYNIIAWDAPAHGESRPFEGFSFDISADYMKEILDACGVKDVFLIGQSLGGYFAQAFIRKYPEHVKGFIPIGSTPFGNAYYSAFDRWILRQVEWMAMLYPPGMMKQAMARQVCLTQEAYDNMVRMLEAYGKKELCHLMGLSYAAFLKENCDTEIPCPVVLMIGEKDRTGKVMAYNRAWTEKTGYPLIVIPDASHNANADNSETVNRIIDEFIQMCSTDAEKGVRA